MKCKKNRNSRKILGATQTGHRSERGYSEHLSAGTNCPYELNTLINTSYLWGINKVNMT